MIEDRGLRPLIGVTTYREQAAWGIWDLPADLLPAVYTRSVEAAGGIAVLLPPQFEAAAAVVTRLDGLIISGGADVDPERYGGRAHPRTGVPRRERDAWEFSLLDVAHTTRIPTLGICRGMQVMAVHAGGRLEQHVPDVVGHEEHSPGGDAFGWIAVDTVAESRVRQLVGDHMQVSCHHHQSVASHPTFVVSARAADGTIEAIEDPEHDFKVAVQWHPENGDDLGLFAGLIQAASRPVAAH